MYYFNLYDPLAVALFSLGVILCSILLFKFMCFLRRIVPKSVECWFCKYKTEVNYAICNSWTCPSCEQYNGFTKDGGYNKVIASQYNETLNLLTVARQIPKNELTTRPTLCKKCNLKQELKVQQLASFIPMCEKNYDREIEHFRFYVVIVCTAMHCQAREQIEKNYELCRSCETLVNKVLQNIREELSLPKKLVSVISQVKIGGEIAIYINILLSLVLAVSSLQGNFSLPAELSTFIHHLQKYINFLSSNYPSLIKISNYWVQCVIATGFLVNSIGYYQTKSSGVFLNSCAWVLMFFLTLYPAQYQQYVSILKVISGVISITISLILITKNYELRSKKKNKLWEKTNDQVYMTSPTLYGNISFPNISRSSSNCNLSTNSVRYRGPKSTKQTPNDEIDNSRFFNSTLNGSKTQNHSTIDEVRSNIDFGLGNLNLGQSYRNETKHRSSKPILTPPKFNPFSGTRNYMSSDKHYHWKPSTPFSFNQYEPSETPSVYDGYEPSVATFTSFGYPQPCYPSCPPTMAYYFATRNIPKSSVMHTSTPVGADKDTMNHKNNWTFIYSLPVIFLIGCNIFLLYNVYNKDTTSLTATA